jgi:MoaA/NifB/PqqE/SkfB family radical SAM enzyme
LHTSLITNGTLLESRIDKIAQYINGALYVSLDGLEKTHDTIRGVNGCFRKALRGITASKSKVHVTINTTIMAESLGLTGRKHRTAKTAISIVMSSPLWRFQEIFRLS